MAIELKHVADLMGMEFRIPSYQRGYRWERKQIEQLLSDLLDFARGLKDAKIIDNENKVWNRKHPEAIKTTDAEDQIGYYCLQPLAVTKKGCLYDVIDGQQRLTTIYLILCYLSTKGWKIPFSNEDIGDKLYGLSYEFRDDDFFRDKKFIEVSRESRENIDFYFMAKAFSVIKDWFELNSIAEVDILQLLLPLDYRFNENDANDLLHDVRFIWYEVEENVSIQTFGNLNYGKIGLTPAELVKAILFECDQYKDEDRKIAREKAFSRSLKWSMMEEHLQDEFFWGMLVSGRKYEDLHLGLILKFVADDIDKNREYTKKEHWDRDDSDWVFNIFYKAVSDQELKDENGDKLASVARRVDYLWARIQNVYTVFSNWFDNRELYHWIGLYVFISVKYTNKVREKVIGELYELYLTSLKDSFKKKLKKKIGQMVKIDGKTLSELRYPDEDSSDKKDADAIRKILLLFNVEMTLGNSQDAPRFPFHLASTPDQNKELKSIEHIHPQHLKTEDLRFEDAKKWFEDRIGKLQPKDVDGELKCAIENLRKNLAGKERFKDCNADVIRDLNILDRKFDELAGMSSDIMHSLRNLALVDEPTNAALGNGLLDEKRQVLIDRTNKKQTYVPLGTWYVYNKHFSNSPLDLKFWSKDDRDAYFNEIEKVYNSFVTL